MDDARLTILRMVAEGTLTAEEADRLLDALNDTGSPASATPVTDDVHEDMTTLTEDGAREHRLTKSFQVEPGGRLVVEADRGSIQVRTAETQTLDVEMIRTVGTSDREAANAILNAMEIDLDQHGNEVHVRVRVHKARHPWWEGNEPRLRVHIVVTVPRQYHLDLKTAGGSISVGDLDGEVHSRTSGGSVHLGHIQGSAWVKTSGGGIALAGCAGMADVKTSGGSIRIGQVDGDVLASTSGGSISIERAAGRVAAQTSGGSITVDEAMNTIEAVTSGGSVTAHLASQPRDHCRLETSGGSVTVYLAETIGVDVNARTSGGQVVTDFPVTVQGELRKTALQAKLNGGGPELIVRTSGGNVYIKKQ